MGCMYVASVLCVVVCLAAWSDAALTADQQQLLLDLHNSMRRGEGASNMNHMTWSSTLADKAQSWADGCDFTHDDTDYGENLWAHSSQTISDLSEAVQDWFDEKSDYNYDSGACENDPCGHYKQIVWDITSELGCGLAVCDPLQNVNFGSGTYIVCNYNPAGNYPDQKPYEKGEACTECQNGIYNCHQDLCMSDCTGVDCDCKACDVCQNCASITPDCTCQCAPGWRGNTCIGTCVNVATNCNFGQSECEVDYAWMSENCPIYCNFCEADDGNGMCDVTGEEYCGLQAGTTGSSDQSSDSTLSTTDESGNQTDSEDNSQTGSSDQSSDSTLSTTDVSGNQTNSDESSQSAANSIYALPIYNVLLYFLYMWSP